MTTTTSQLMADSVNSAHQLFRGKVIFDDLKNSALVNTGINPFRFFENDGVIYFEEFNESKDKYRECLRARSTASAVRILLFKLQEYKTIRDTE